ncbi:MAG TPA: hypothetical protein VKS78_14475 [Roseiarcus sp.]|nr:hypothetical protein [Roseiarcus sp.]
MVQRPLAILAFLLALAAGFYFAKQNRRPPPVNTNSFSLPQNHLPA